MKKQRALARIPREGRRALELRACFVKSADLLEEIAPHARQEMVPPKCRLRSQRIDELEARCWTERHRNSNGTIQLHDG